MSLPLKRKHQKQSKNPRVLVRSKQEPAEDQVDLCPRIWSREFNKSHPSDEIDRSSSSAIHFWSKAWRICFYCSCLPICYPCYVSRSIRRRKRRHQDPPERIRPTGVAASAASVHASEQTNLFDTSGDTMGKTMFHRASQRKKDSNENIDVNVILLRSESSPKLECYLANKRETLSASDVDSGINKFLNVTRNLTLQRGHNNYNNNQASTLNENNAQTLQGPSVSQTANGDARPWRTFIQLQKWKRSFRRSNSIKRPSTILPSDIPLRNNNYESMRSSITEFFDARSVVSIEEESNYHSLGSSRGVQDSINCDSLKVYQNKPLVVHKTRHHVKPLGSRMIECEGIGYKLQVSIFDEGTITNWSGVDLDQLGSCNIDVVLVILSSDQELNRLMNLNKGLLNYLGEHWRGFYPLLMVELVDDELDLEEGSSSSPPPTIESSWCLATLFGDVYRVRMKENELFDNTDWLTDVMGRLYLHSRLYQCSKFYGKGINELSECPGGCQLSKINANKRSLPFTRKKVKWKMRSLVRFSKLASEGTGQGRL